jgi:hypothetical protein
LDVIDRGPTLTVVDLDARSTELEVLYTFAADTAERALTNLRLVSRTFATAGANGAFSAFDGVRSHLEMSFEILRSAEQVAHRFECINVDIRAFQCLRNMARRLRRDKVIVTHVMVTGAGGQGVRVVDMPWPTDTNEAQAYPEMSPRVKAVFAQEDSEFAKSRRCLVEVAQPLESDTVLAFERSVEPWYRLIEAGGYATPIGLPEEVESISGAVNQFDERSIEVAIDRLSASEQVWVPLANIAQTFWERSGGLRRLIVD